MPAPTPPPYPGSAPARPAYGLDAAVPHVRFSRTEFLHLAAAVLILAVAFSYVLDYQSLRFTADPDSGLGRDLLPSLLTFLASLGAVASGFVLHELAHKLLAQRYGHWAEFRAQFTGLGLTLVVAVLTGYLFSAPGAVLIRGPVTPRENGLISLVGPGVNLAIAAVLLPFIPAVNQDSASATVIGTIAFINALLGLFNLIPLGPMDGRKVWHWSKAAYLVTLAVAIALFVAVLLVK